jgi:hypothetical protein
MTIYPKPQNLNGTELMAELAAVGVFVERVKDNGDNTITLETTDKKAETVVAKHNGTIVAPKLTVTEKLQLLGLTEEEAQLILGGSN